MPYPESFKRAMVRRMVSPGAPSVRSLSRDVGVPESTLSRWRREARSRYDRLLDPSRLTDQGRERVERLSARNLLTAKAHQMRLTLQETWSLSAGAKAKKHLKTWCTWVRRVAAPPKGASAWVLERMHTAATTIRKGLDRILNDFRLRLTSGVIEGVNSLAQAARSRTRGYRNPQHLQVHPLPDRRRPGRPSARRHPREIARSLDVAGV